MGVLAWHGGGFGLAGTAAVGAQHRRREESKTMDDPNSNVTIATLNAAVDTAWVMVSAMFVVYVTPLLATASLTSAAIATTCLMCPAGAIVTCALSARLHVCFCWPLRSRRTGLCSLGLPCWKLVQ